MKFVSEQRRMTTVWTPNFLWATLYNSPENRRCDDDTDDDDDDAVKYATEKRTQPWWTSACWASPHSWCLPDSPPRSSPSSSCHLKQQFAFTDTVPHALTQKRKQTPDKLIFKHFADQINVCNVAQMNWQWITDGQKNFKLGEHNGRLTQPKIIIIIIMTNLACCKPKHQGQVTCCKFRKPTEYIEYFVSRWKIYP